MRNLVTEVRPENLVVYGKLLVAFFDEFKNKNIDDYGNITIPEGAEPELYIHIQNSDDKYSVLRRKATERINKIGRRADEKVLFKSAYDKYLAFKEGKSALDPEKEALKAKIAELESKAKKVKIKPIAEKIEIEPKTEPKE